MVAPLIAAGLKYGAGRLLENVGLPSGITNAKGYLMGQLQGVVDRTAGVAPGTTSLISDPKSALTNAAKNYAKDLAVDSFKNRSGNQENAIQATPSSGREMDTADYGGGLKRGGKVKSASRRGDGIAQRGKTKGRYL